MEKDLLPTSEELSRELMRTKRSSGWVRRLRDVLVCLLAAAAAIVLITNLWLPVLQVTGGSMEPTLSDGQLVIAVKTDDLQQGDICFFYDGARILCKRVIGKAGDVINIDEDGSVSVNGQRISEPYLKDKADLFGGKGDCDITFPCTVPADSYFVLGDERETSIDSRHSEIGFVSRDRVLGKGIFRLWPFTKAGVC